MYVPQRRKGQEGKISVPSVLSVVKNLCHVRLRVFDNCRRRVILGAYFLFQLRLRSESEKLC